MQLDIMIAENRAFAEAYVFESAGGYSPTIGIIGAVLRLIQVMKNLSNIDEVGHGIAVAFVATVYGVGIANLLLLPAATKIKARIESEPTLKELKLEGVVAIDARGAKARAVSESVKRALQGESFKSAFAILLGGPGNLKGSAIRNNPVWEVTRK